MCECLSLNLCQTGDGSDLRVEVSALRKLLHHNGADMVQQRLLVHGVLHLRDLLQVTQLEAFSLHANTAPEEKLQMV